MSTDLSAVDGPLDEHSELPPSAAANPKKKAAAKQTTDVAASEDDRREQLEFENLTRIVSRSLEPRLDSREIEEYVRCVAFPPSACRWALGPRLAC